MRELAALIGSSGVGQHISWHLRRGGLGAGAEDGVEGKLDGLLPVIAALNAGYFTSCFWRFPAHVPTDLYAVASAVCALSFLGHAAAAGWLGGGAARGKDKVGKSA